jgi:hypothetical protein
LGKGRINEAAKDVAGPHLSLYSVLKRRPLTLRHTDVLRRPLLVALNLLHNLPHFLLLLRVQSLTSLSPLDHIRKEPETLVPEVGVDGLDFARGTGGKSGGGV